MNNEVIWIIIVNVSFGLLCIYKWWETSVKNKYVFDYTPTPEGYLRIYDKKEEG